MHTPAAISGTLLFISGPSGVGKSTVCRRLAVELPAEFALSVTTRPGKPQDVFGKKYRFVDPAEFRRLLEAGELLEYAQVFGNFYGTLKQPVEESLAAGKTMLLEIDVQGAMQISKLFPAAKGVFILPPSPQELTRRLKERQRDSEAEIFQRITEAQQEVRTARASNVFSLFVVNQNLDSTIAEIKHFLVKR